MRFWKELMKIKYKKANMNKIYRIDDSLGELKNFLKEKILFVYPNKLSVDNEKVEFDYDQNLN